ncbi:DUF4209 domain-containing protein [Streptomyces sp. NPDC002133]|uniref:DUF4209 domain-containing protein n=1 Tax=Streptomyces sp. NPDC002133 TaxID=3154409 RepID=UPI00331FAF85
MKERQPPNAIDDLLRVLTVCANPAGGWNLRNKAAHGFIDEVSVPAAAAVLQVALYMWPLYGRDGQGPKDSSPENRPAGQ